MAGAWSIRIGAAGSGITFDSLVLEATGRAIVRGWSRDPDPALGSLQLSVDGESSALVARYATRRPDVADALGVSDDLLGFDAVFGDARGRSGIAQLRLTFAGTTLLDCRQEWCASEPHYASLLTESRILGRHEIYGEGPPVAANAPEIVALTNRLRGRVLDFGCGSGFLVASMRARGIAAHGLEIDRPAIRASLHADAAAHVTLYDGSLPLPFPDRSFDSVFSTEVVEHIPDPERIVAELARIASRMLIVTVPDNSAIPQLFHSNVVPWHMLESTHINFFTQQSLQTVLARHFPKIRMARLGPATTNGTVWYTSLAAICER